MSNKVEAVFSDVLGIPLESITEETSPENTPEWDSAQAVNLVLALEDAFQIRLSTKEIVSMRDIALVKKVLRTKGVANV
jgi:acyl carrier protein